MKFLTPENGELMDIASIERDGNDLIIKGKIFGAMPMAAKLTPEEARTVFKLLDFKMILFLLTFLFRGKR